MEEQKYLISDAARIVKVEAHVLRYWEEELELPIGRTELGHRYYNSHFHPPLLPCFWLIGSTNLNSKKNSAHRFHTCIVYLILCFVNN